MIRLVDINKIYAKKLSYGFHALHDINLLFEKKEFVAILGSSGCGKTTLLNIIGGIDTPSSGNIAINGKLTAKFTENEWNDFRARHIGYIFQKYNLINHLTVLDNITIAGKILGMKSKEALKKALELLEKVDMLEHKDKKPFQLSGGEQQRVAIARALITDPEVILADEPTGALDSVNGKKILDLIAEMGKDKIVIMVTHNRKIALEYSNRIIEMEDGHVIKDSNPEIKKVDVSLTKPLEYSKMNFIETVKYAFKSFISRKGRSLLMAFGLAIGLSLLMLTSAVSTATNKEDTDSSIDIVDYDRGIELTVDDLDYNSAINELKAIDGVSNVMCFPYGGFMSVKYVESNGSMVELVNAPHISSYNTWVNNEELKLSSISLNNSGKMPENDNEVVLDYASARRFFPAMVNFDSDDMYKEIMNKKVIITYRGEVIDNDIVDTDNVEDRYYDKSKEFIVVGICEENSNQATIFTQNGLDTFLGTQTDNDEITVPYHFVARVFMKDDATKSRVQLINDLRTNDYFSDVAGLYHESSNDGNIFDLDNIFTSIYSFFMSSATIISIVTAALMLVILLTVSLFERKKEIGLLRAIGIRKLDVREIFLIESMFISLFSILISLIFVIIVISLVNYVIPVDIISFFFPFTSKGIKLSLENISFSYLIFGTIFLVMAVSLFPSSMAARENPAEALRNE